MALSCTSARLRQAPARLRPQSEQGSKGRELVERQKAWDVCPSCPTKRAVKFAEHLYKNVPEEAPQRHVILKMPKRLGAHSKYHQSLMGTLLDVARASISECVG